jgi:hypothetical protein
MNIMFSPKVLLSPSLVFSASSTRFESLSFFLSPRIVGRIGGGRLPPFPDEEEVEGRETTMNCSLSAMRSLMRE